MILFLAGAAFGHLDQLYNRVAELESIVGTPDYVLQTGNLGLFPDRTRFSRAMRKHNGGDDFAKWYATHKEAPYPTVFVPGRHEDHRWLFHMQSIRRLEIIPNLTLLANGYSTRLGFGEHECNILGLGKVFSEDTYWGGGSAAKKKNRMHITRTEVERSLDNSHGRVDILLLHDRSVLGQIEKMQPTLTICPARSSSEIKDEYILPLQEQEVIPILWGRGGWRYLMI